MSPYEKNRLRIVVLVFSTTAYIHPHINTKNKATEINHFRNVYFSSR